MSKKQSKAQASSARAAVSAFAGFRTSSHAAFGTSSSQLSYVTEPPDLSHLSDPNAVVYFRNLSKKDNTTKTKALEELQSYVSALEGPLEEGFLEAWIEIYPRTSISNSKSVRQNAHTLHGHIAASAGKRIARHMPKAVGAWLCGLYDTDRSVVEATQSSLRLVFNTPEKIQNIRRAYQQPILEYCRNAIDKETTYTLSDDRTESPDDAAAKYSRVISGCLSLLGSLLSNLSAEDRSKFHSDYTSTLEDAKVWEFASHQDASIRRSAHRFVKVCLEKESDTLADNLDVICKNYLGSALNSDQSGSAYDYIDVLVLLTSRYPTVWTKHYKNKTSVERRLRQFLKKGSQHGPREFWQRLVDLFKLLPREVLPTNGADAAELLNALHGGIIRKDESRTSLETAYDAYLDITGIICQDLSKDEQQRLSRELVLPLVSQFLQPTIESADWTVNNVSDSLITKALSSAPVAIVAQEEWPRYTQLLVNDIRTSAPEQSKDYRSSQDSLIARAARLATVQKHVLNANRPSPLKSTFTQTCVAIIDTGLDQLKRRNGKPYGAAGAVAQFLTSNRTLILSDQGCREKIENFIKDHLPYLILSASASYLVEVLYSMSESAEFKRAWSLSLKNVLAAEDSQTKSSAVNALLTSAKIPPTLDLAFDDPELQAYIKENAMAALEGNSDWDFFTHILQSPRNIISDSTIDDILTSMTQSLSLSEQAPYALEGYRHVIKQNPAFMTSYLSSQNGSSLLQGLLLATESPDDEIAQAATALNASIRTLLAAESASKQSIVDLIHRGLRDASSTSVSVETLVDLAKQLLEHSTQEEQGTNTGSEEMVKVYPDLKDWDAALSPFLDIQPKSSLAITNRLGGAVYLVQQNQVSYHKVPRDADGYSPAYRITRYVTKIIKERNAAIILDKLPAVERRCIFRNLALTVQLATDNLGLAGANHLWANYNTDAEVEATAFLSDALEILAHTAQVEQRASESPFLDWAVGVLLNAESDLCPRAYYTIRAASVTMSDSIEHNGWHNRQGVDFQSTMRNSRKSKGTLALLGFLHAFGEQLVASRASERLCNELVADLTGLNVQVKADEGLRQLVILNAILSGQQGVSDSIAKQRLIFFVKHVVPWLQDYSLSLPIRAELCRALASVLPLMSDIYGDHWRDILTALTATWKMATELGDRESGMDSYVPLIHASLKLYDQLRSLVHSEDPNDDLVDVWKESEEDVAAGLINLLKHSQHFSDDFHQPLKIVNEVLARQIAKLSLKNLESMEDLFPLLYVESQPVQQTAFDILHKQIPAAQEKISIEAALEKTTARLPEELLSLIIEAPTVAALADATFERNVPLPLRGYLLSWLLVFDHFENSSFKVKNDYIEHIREGDYLPGLLNFTFDFLGHSKSKPADVSKLDITTYVPDVEPPRRDAQWLLTHLYFLCLEHIPALTKAWWKDCKSRPVVVTLEGWTEKYVSPPVITAALNSVSEWANSLSETETESDFTVKVSHRTREIITSYVVDEQTMSMRITLPPAFPLSNAIIEGINRVAVNEQRWQSWLRTSLGAITIFNGSLIDALTTFKRNVEGAIKGMTECAICYSIVGSDKKLPDKRCSTCKNLFHGGCLFKWFKTSGGSSCPLCRNPFNYG
ncbi:RING zinc finger protein-like protein [Westerdykella ornata]|uniref:E3 ubiquitin-protein ligase listerin n=1 Tax=Westerdykella ornata TaxID=318751 RepID=A0A6A6J6M7_WESOR|nr:RING zinc finger protein-like protein [Westerdykella ornata]KAF2272230.1 RING zinc finger protein-like protein [Westerdykella ornata]